MNSKTVQFHLEANTFPWEISPGKTIEAQGYNRQLPGPTLKARRGDTLVVTLENNLPEPTTIHWHGLRTPARMDGTEEVQKPIQPGESFEYRFTLPDAGTFWYHSHFNETQQLERGLYGALIVEDESDPAVDSDRVFMIDDMKLTPDHKFKQPRWPLPRFVERHDGREGNTLLINGREMPVIEVHAGQTERWRFINASSARYVVLFLDGKPFRIIGTDGGLLETPREATQVLLTPGERLDVAAGPYEEGDTFFIGSLPYNRMTSVKPKQQRFARVQVTPARPSVAKIPSELRKIDPLTQPGTPANRIITFSVGPSLRRGLDFRVNDDLHTQDEPVPIGELQVWEIKNTSLMDHPFHLHGFFFQVLEINGVPPAYPAWKDTINLPPRTTVKIAWIADNRPGNWMYHCHILEHHAAGMMAHFEVVEPNARPQSDHHQTTHHH